MNATSEITEEAFLSEIFKTAKMGADAVISLLPRVKNDALRSHLTLQLDGYEKYAAKARYALEQMGEDAREENIFSRLLAKGGIAINTMMDDTVSHLAEMMIEGSNMAVTAMTRLLNHYREDGEAVRLARELLRFEEHNVEQLKSFL